jgi:hypothetical protein
MLNAREPKVVSGMLNVREPKMLVRPETIR